MNSSELHRKLLYCGYGDLTDYLKHSPLNRFLHDRLLKMVENSHLDLSAVIIFNEVYYQCVHIQTDGTPGENVESRYLDEEKLWLKSKDAAEVVFYLVFAILGLKQNRTFHEECFINQCDPIFFRSASRYIVNDMVDRMRQLEITVPDTFPTKPAPIEEIPMIIHSRFGRCGILRFVFGMKSEDDQKDFNPWRKVTNGFSRSSIEWLIRLYDTRQDQLDLLNRIEKACSDSEYKRLRTFFGQLRGKLSSGFYVGTSMSYSHFTESQGESSDKSSFQTTDESMETERCEELMKQLQAQKADYEMQLARMEAKYQTEIALLKKENEQTTHNVNISKEQSIVSTDQMTAEPQVHSFTIAEMATHIKEHFSKQGADEVCTMLYALAMKHSYTDEETFKLIDGIDQAILRRNTPHQTLDFPNVTQFNNNPQTVINHGNKD